MIVCLSLPKIRLLKIIVRLHFDYVLGNFQFRSLIRSVVEKRSQNGFCVLLSTACFPFVIMYVENLNCST